MGHYNILHRNALCIDRIEPSHEGCEYYAGIISSIIDSSKHRALCWHNSVIFSPVHIAHAQFSRDSIGKMTECTEPGCNTSSLSDSLASGTKFTTLSSDGEDVEDSGKMPLRVRAGLVLSRRTCVSAKCG